MRASTQPPSRAVDFARSAFSRAAFRSFDIGLAETERKSPPPLPRVCKTLITFKYKYATRAGIHLSGKNAVRLLLKETSRYPSTYLSAFYPPRRFAEGSRRTVGLLATAKHSNWNATSIGNLCCAKFAAEGERNARFNARFFSFLPSFFFFLATRQPLGAINIWIRNCLIEKTACFSNRL